jgi:5-methylcytosine-specific restriction enzyme A
MRTAHTVIYRYLSNADFFNIYKPAGAEVGGGGQTYIDFLTRFIPIDDWRAFFQGIAAVIEDAGAQGPRWTVPINNIGIPARQRMQQVVIYQRRPASVCVSSQRLQGRGANRVIAWNPQFGFPEPVDPNNRFELPPGLAIYFVRTYEGEIWAGWFQQPVIYRDPLAGDLLRQMLADDEPGSVGILRFRQGQLSFDEEDPVRPFFTIAREGQPGRNEDRVREPEPRYDRSEELLLRSLFQEDENIPENPERREYVVAVRRRNSAAVRALKQLYRHECQVTGTRWIFRKRDGVNYTEAHHLIPLGEGGADDPRNIIIVSPLLHRMLHHANVPPFQLADIEQQPDGTGTLEITINDQRHTIRWHREHARAVLGGA